MVIIDNYFIHFKRPVQYIFAGESYLDIYTKTDKTLSKSGSYDNVSLFTASASEFGGVIQGMAKGDTGIILNSAYFIFNIIEFDRLPLREKTRHELIEWRLKKVFPENLSDYDHQYFKLNKQKILSVLFKKELKEKIETLFAANNVKLTYMGNSTVNMFNGLLTKRNAPDFFIELDRNLTVLAFQSGSIPYYIRKFRSGSEEDVVGDIQKTINYVKNSYNRTPATYTLSVNRSSLDVELIKSRLGQQDVKYIPFKNIEKFKLPG